MLLKSYCKVLYLHPSSKNNYSMTPNLLITISWNIENMRYVPIVNLNSSTDNV